MSTEETTPPVPGIPSEDAETPFVPEGGWGGGLPLDELPDLVTLTNGIKLKAKAFPRAILRSALQRFPDPEVPVVDFGEDDTEENPNDPDYIKAWEDVHEERLEAAARVVLGYGIEVAEVPEKMYGPQDDHWIADIEFLGGKVGDVSSPFRKQFEWLNLYAIPNETERTLVFLVAQQAAGVLEREVIAAMKFFQDLGARRTRDYREATGASAREARSRDTVRKRGPVVGKRVRGKGRRKK